MANKKLFKTAPGPLLPETDTVNFEGAQAYSMKAEQALAQYVATGCLNSTFYASAEFQLGGLIKMALRVDPLFAAKTAVYGREKAYMKDAPAVLCALLSVTAPELLVKVFPRVIDSGKMLRNFVQVLRSGAVGRKSMGSRPKKLVLDWLEGRDEEALFRASVGNAPSLSDVIKMVHPKPKSPLREAFYGYLLDKNVNRAALPEVIRKFEEFKAGESAEIPDVPFEMLTSLELGTKEWSAIAEKASWQTTRMNLNTFARHGVFSSSHLTSVIAGRLRNPKLIERARVFPYQLLVALHSTGKDVPDLVREALHDAMETALGNVPATGGKVVVCPDVSGSMSSPVTGYRKGSTTAVRCVDVAALVAAAILRKNRDSEVIPFEDKVVTVKLERRDTVLTNATKLAAAGGGGTNCSAPLVFLNKKKEKADLVIYVSDNQSWVDARGSGGSAVMREWAHFKERSPNARLVCIDIQPYTTSQAAERGDILNIGGFSDAVFTVINEFAAGTLAADHWVAEINRIEL